MNAKTDKEKQQRVGKHQRAIVAGAEHGAVPKASAELSGNIRIEFFHVG